MPILLADSNFLQKPALKAYLSKSRSNRIALAQEVLVEMHKREPAYTIRKCLEIPRGFPKQVVVLRDVTCMYGVPIRSAADARNMIDWRQTNSFARWYDDILKAEHDQEITDILAKTHKKAKIQVDEIAASVKHIQPIFKNIKNKFTKEELTELRNRVPYSRNTQRKLLDVMYDMSREIFLNLNVPKSQCPQLNVHAFQYFIHRYAMCMTLLYTRWVHRGNLSDDTDKLVNHVVDMHLAALGTFFGGVLSDDEMLFDIHREVRWLLRVSEVAFLG